MGLKMSYYKLCDVCDFQGGSQPPKDEWSLELKPGYIRMLQIRDFTQTERTIPEYIKITNTTKICEENDILIARYGASLGKILTGLKGAYNVAIMKTIPNINVLDKKYLYYYLKSPVFQRFLLNVGSRAAQAGFNKNDLQDLLIPKISKDKQGEIVRILEMVEKVIIARKNEISLLDNLIKARFVEMFGIPDENECYGEKTILAEHLDVVGGYAFKSDKFTDYGIPVLRIGNINTGKFLPINLVFWNNDETLQKYKVLPGDLVMSLTGTVGKDDYGNVCILDESFQEYYLNQRNAKLVLKQTMNKYYLSELLKFGQVKKKLTGISRGVRQANISNKDILELQVYVPPIGLQNQFADFVQQIDKSKLSVQKSLDKLEILKKALMQKYFG